MNHEKVFTDLGNLIKVENYDKAHEIFVQESLINQAIILSKEKFVGNSEFSQRIWHWLLQHPEKIDRILKTDHAEEILFLAIKNSTLKNDSLLAAFLNSNPELLIELIKHKQLFLDEDWYSFLIKLHLPTEHALHQKAWEILRKEDLHLWSQFEKYKARIDGYTIENLLIASVIWFEKKRFNQDPDSWELGLHLDHTFQLFIHYVLAERPTSQFIANEKTAVRFIIRFADLLKNDTTIREAFSALDALYEWSQFHTICLHEYAYEKGNLEETPGGLVTKLIPSDYYHWKLDGIRYDHTLLNYHKEGGKQTVYKVIRENMLIPGKTEKDIDNNIIYADSKYSSLKFLDDLQISDLPADGYATNRENILVSLIGLSLNRKIRYAEVFHEETVKKKSWEKTALEFYHYILSNSIHRDKAINSLPFLFDSRKELFDRLSKGKPGMRSEEIHHLLQTFSQKLVPKAPEDRYHVVGRNFLEPFILIGDYYFSPIAFLSNCTWFYSFVQKTIEERKKHNTHRKRASDLEKILASLGETKKLTVRTFSQEDVDQIDGDADVIFEDDSATLFLQVKFTYFRVNPADRVLEEKSVDKKGRLQLQRAKAFFSKPNAYFSPKHNPVCWLVSTSFEGINRSEHEIRKINYFELLRALRNPDIHTVEELILEMEGDAELIRVLRSKIIIEQEQPEFENPLPLPMPINWAHDIFKPISWIELKNANAPSNLELARAQKLVQENKAEEAIEIYCRYLEDHETDAVIWCIVAELFAKKGDRKTALVYYDMALSLQPEHPAILEVFADYLLNNNKLEAGFCLLDILANLYPFQNDTYRFFMETVEQSGLILKTPPNTQLKIFDTQLRLLPLEIRRKVFENFEKITGTRR